MRRFRISVAPIGTLASALLPRNISRSQASRNHCHLKASRPDPTTTPVPPICGNHENHIQIQADIPLASQRLDNQSPVLAGKPYPCQVTVSACRRSTLPTNIVCKTVQSSVPDHLDRSRFRTRSCYLHRTHTLTSTTRRNPKRGKWRSRGTRDPTDAREI